MASFVDGRGDSKKLIYEGFIYLKRGTTKNKSYWKCELWSKNKCHGTATTDENNFVVIGKQHNHEPSPSSVELARRHKESKIPCPFCGVSFMSSLGRHFSR